jgi:hypothetical protein
VYSREALKKKKEFYRRPDFFCFALSRFVPPLSLSLSPLLELLSLLLLLLLLLLLSWVAPFRLLRCDWRREALLRFADEEGNRAEEEDADDDDLSAAVAPCPTDDDDAAVKRATAVAAEAATMSAQRENTNTPWQNKVSF